jgi:uncharacterized protein (DUF1778 family)
MTRLTLRLPESLHAMLEEQSRREGMSLNQFIVYALTRQTVLTHVTDPLPAAEIAAQQARFHALQRKLGPPADDAALARFMRQRERKGTRKSSQKAQETIKRKLARRAAP